MDRMDAATLKLLQESLNDIKKSLQELRGSPLNADSLATLDSKVSQLVDAATEKKLRDQIKNNVIVFGLDRDDGDQSDLVLARLLLQTAGGAVSDIEDVVRMGYKTPRPLKIELKSAEAKEQLLENQKKSLEAIRESVAYVREELTESQLRERRELVQECRKRQKDQPNKDFEVDFLLGIVREVSPKKKSKGPQTQDESRTAYLDLSAYNLRTWTASHLAKNIFEENAHAPERLPVRVYKVARGTALRLQFLTTKARDEAVDRRLFVDKAMVQLTKPFQERAKDRKLLKRSSTGVQT